jgi:hypothetical protein
MKFVEKIEKQNTVEWNGEKVGVKGRITRKRKEKKRKKKKGRKIPRTNKERNKGRHQYNINI